MKNEKTAIHVWVFESSDGTKTYQTLKWSDGSTSCDCAGWTRRVAVKIGANGPEKVRTCKHVRMVIAGCASEYCLKNSDLTVMDTAQQSDSVPPVVAAYARKFG